MARQACGAAGANAANLRHSLKMGDPNLIIQLRRLGDLVLTFPLLLDLAHRQPQNPLWLVAETDFFQHLMPFSPNVVFFGPEKLPDLAKRRFGTILNLSSRPDAASCTGRAEADLKLGPALSTTGLHIEGFWQLYRAALTGNNRHNIFHWADLNRMDLGLPLSKITPAFQTGPRSGGHIGLFIGASEAGKRPDANFWVDLGKRLLKLNLKPVLLGGPGERAMGQEIVRRIALPNFCGMTNLTQLAGIMRGLDLFITPDTGPMHLADWLGTKVLNLSLGNVNPWETGPLGGNQFILQANMSCVGCWKCSRPRQYCRQKFIPALVAALVAKILAGYETGALSGFNVFKSGRTGDGFYCLTKQAGKLSGRELLDQFWQKAFLFLSKSTYKKEMQSSLRLLHVEQPALALHLRHNLEKMLLTLAKNRKTTLDDSFWQRQPFHSRLLAGFMQMDLQNRNFAPAAYAENLQRLEQLGAAFSTL